MKKSGVLLMLLMVLLPTQVFAAASVNVASGSHHQEFDLFDMNSAGILPTFSISYESISWTVGTLGRGWTHSFDTTLSDKNTIKDNLLQVDLFGDHFIFHLKDGKYLPAEWDHSTLDMEKNGAYVIKRDGLSYFFDKDKQLTAIAGRSGAKTSFTFANGKMSRIVTPEKKTITLDYGAGGRLVRITDPAGKAYTITYDDGGYPAAINYPDGSSWRFKNDAEGYMLVKTDRQGLTTTYTYDDKHRVTGSLDSKGKTTTLNYTDGNEREKTTSYNHNGEIEDLTYDAYSGKPIKTVDPTGGLITYTHDKNGKMTSETDPSGRTTSYTYDEHGQMTGMRDPDGNVTTYAYDGKGNLITVADPVRGAVHNEYDAKGRMTKTTGSDGNAFTYVYDAQGNLAAVKGPDGAILQVPPEVTESELLK